MSHDMTQQVALTEDELAKMSFFLKHLEEKWCLKKRKNTYILKKKDGTKLTYTSAYLENNCHVIENAGLKRMQLLTFIHNALEDGWNIKKKTSCNNYVFVKKHNGEYKMYEDDEYLTEFMKRNLSLQ